MIGVATGILVLVCAFPLGNFEVPEARQDPAQARQLFEAELAAKSWNTAGELLARASLSGPGLRLPDAAAALTALSAEELATIAGSRDFPEAVARCLDWLRLRVGTEQDAYFARLATLLGKDEWVRFVATQGGQDALAAARRGSAQGLELLEAILARYGRAPWAAANLALGLRLLGRYEEAAEWYRRAMEFEGARRAWLLNEAALVELGRLRRDAAEELLRLGCRDEKDVAGRGTCQGNLARLLMYRADRNPKRRAALLGEAQQLLEAALEQDPNRTRSRYWLARLRRGSRD